MSAIESVTVTPARLPAVPTAAPAQDDSDVGFSFDDLIDTINPLQHIPIIGTLYRHLTGDTINTVPKIAGDTLYGGLEGFATSVADTIFEKVTGHNFGDTVYQMAQNLFDGGSSDDAPPTTAPTTAVAANTPAEPSLLDRIENFFSSSPAQAPVTAVAANAPIDATATPVPSDAPALPPPASVTAAALDTIILPGQDTLLSGVHQVGSTADAVLRGSNAYRRAVSVHAVNTGAQIPRLRATLD